MTEVPAPRKRRRPLVWVIVLLVVAGLLVAAWFGGEAIARNVVTGIVKEQVGAALGLPKGHPMDVEIDGAMIPQLIKGSFDTIDVASRDVTIGPVNGDLVGTAHGMRFDGSADDMTATLALTEEQLRTLLPTDRVQVKSIAFDAPKVRFGTSFEVWSLPIDVELALTPGVKNGDLLLNPEGFKIGDFEVTAQDLQGRLGGVAEQVLQPWQICIADQIPAGVTITDVRVSGDRLRATADIDGSIATDAAKQQLGTCG